MFDEVVLRFNLGCKILVGHLVVCRLGQDQRQSIVAISQSLDKLVVHDCRSYDSAESQSINNIEDSIADVQLESSFNVPIYYISIRDVIKTVSVRKIKLSKPKNELIRDSNDNSQAKYKHSDESTANDLLLIGSSNSILIYDASSKNNLQTINVPHPINAIASDSLHSLAEAENVKDQSIICGGSQKIYNIRFELQLRGSSVDAEIICSRATGDTISCLIQGYLSADLVITGSNEGKIRVYLIDSFDHNIQDSRLKIEENSKIMCLCPINSLDGIQKTMSSDSNTLPDMTNQTVTFEQTNYFAYGLESGFIGVYRLFKPSDESQDTIASERLWRHKCNCIPLTIMMYDINGDGLEELIIGYKNSRIEARSPFTGQLLAVTRCFRSDHLVGLTLMDYYLAGELILLACSTNGSVIGFKPKVSKLRMPLRGFRLQGSQLQQNKDLANSSQMKNVNGVAKFRTIEEDQDRDVFTKEETDLHIESQCDETKASKCVSRQNLNLLQRINALQNEQMELEKRACHIYHMNILQTSNFYPSDVNVGHKWDFDFTTLYLRLTIVVSTNVEVIKLIKLEDESKNFLTAGYLLVNPSRTESSQNGANSYVIVIPLRSNKIAETELDVKVFSELGNAQNKLSRIHDTRILIPKFAMFTFAPVVELENEDSRDKSIKMVYQLKDNSKVVQVLNWLEANFLCFQFKVAPRELQTSCPQMVSIPHPHFALDDKNNFKLNLIDIRDTLKKIANLTSSEFAKNRAKVECKFIKHSSMLRIVHSNGELTFECESSDLAVDLIQSLMIDRLNLEPSRERLERGEIVAGVQPILNELDTVTKNLRELEESEKRIQSELYESADYTRILMEQFALANELNEFTTAKELLNELSIMLTEAQNAARAHCLNSKRTELLKQVNELEEKIFILSGLPAEQKH